VVWQAAHLVQALPEALTLAGFGSYDIVCKNDGYLSLLPNFLIEESFTIVVKGCLGGNCWIWNMGFYSDPNNVNDRPLFRMGLAHYHVYLLAATKFGMPPIILTSYPEIHVATDNAQVAFVQDRKAAMWTVYGSNWMDDYNTKTVSKSLDIPEDFEWYKRSGTIVGTAPNSKSDDQFNGMLYSIRVYPGALSQTAIEQLSTIQDLPLVIPVD